MVPQRRAAHRLQFLARALSPSRPRLSQASKNACQQKDGGGSRILARSDHRLIAVPDQFDADPFLLATPDGVVDLKTGKIRQARQLDYITKVTAVAPSGAPCPNWKEFLKRITDGDDDLQRYLQRVVGYALTGDTSEHALFFAYGTGANGKSTFLNAVSGMIGDYHRTAPIETFTDSKTDRHPTDLAGFRGARMVTAVETEEGRRWAESKIKVSLVATRSAHGSCGKISSSMCRSSDS